MRIAVGEQQITAIGGSYGTRLGAVYATLFPDRVRAMVLDGYDDANTPYGDYLVRQNVAFSVKFSSTSCSPSAPPTRGTAVSLNVDGDPGATLDRLLAEPRPAATPTADGRRTTGATASPTE